MPDAATLERRAKLLEPRVVLGALTTQAGVVSEAFVSIQNPVSLDFIYRRYVDFMGLMQSTPKYTKLKIVGTWEDTDTYELVTFSLADEAEILGVRHNRPLQVLVKATGERLSVDITDGVRRYIVMTVLNEWDQIKRW